MGIGILPISHALDTLTRLVKANYLGYTGADVSATFPIHTISGLAATGLSAVGVGGLCLSLRYSLRQVADDGSGLPTDRGPDRG